MNEPILCSGNDLADVCAGIRARGGSVTSLEARISGNAGYRVNYFERVAERTTRESKAEEAEIGRVDHGRLVGPHPAALTTAVISDRPDGVESADLGRRDDLSIEDRMAALQARLAASGKLGASRFKSTKEARLPHPND